MKTLRGIGTSDGYAIGTVRFLKPHTAKVERRTASDSAQELALLRDAVRQAKEELDALFQEALEKVGEKAAEIFSVHGMLLEDPDYTESIENYITAEAMSAQAAVEQTGAEFAEMFASMEDVFMRERAADIKDISQRLIRKLNGEEAAPAAPTQPYIAAAEDLTPSQTVSLDKALIQAIVTEKGSEFSHSAILARIMGIPAVAALGGEIGEGLDGAVIIVDGAAGQVILDPDEATLQTYQEKLAAFRQEREELERYAKQAPVTRDGRAVEVCANAADVADARKAVQNGAMGIGLFRSEFLYMDRAQLPSEEEQFQTYKAILEATKPGKVVVRTLDIGADKHTDCLDLPREENPALGYRAIRICLSRPELFRTQLRALLRASVYGELAVMFPMIISESEVIQARAIADEEKARLTAEGIPVAENIEWGIMIETPASAIMSDRLARHVDFFSIGTNDLTQYTLACDRMNAQIGQLYDAMDPAVLRFIRMAIDNAHKAGIWAGMCGEAAADARLIPILLKLGLDEFSVASGSIPRLKKQIIETNTAEVMLPEELRA
ncbi:phosphoenolpyruvate--protein phosphotransferase [Vermiculatibacterium agrestimuris]|uniref:phosphoenolpyruvate--protein phosphotransferase n=1 Tax=Vermiculatibacterium agrestimuris TaxID=2941519 RepID=UPI002041087A|nr:phosphoenolpyruvate--protein phosphotransferase [Vermiculatibacterium agrestimuris]